MVPQRSDGVRGVRAQGGDHMLPTLQAESEKTLIPPSANSQTRRVYTVDPEQLRRRGGDAVT